MEREERVGESGRERERESRERGWMVESGRES